MTSINVFIKNSKSGCEDGITICVNTALHSYQLAGCIKLASIIKLNFNHLTQFIQHGKHWSYSV